MGKKSRRLKPTGSTLPKQRRGLYMYDATSQGIIQSERKQENSKAIEIGTYSMDISNIPDGNYLLIINIEGEIQNYNILIYK